MEALLLMGIAVVYIMVTVIRSQKYQAKPSRNVSTQPVLIISLASSINSKRCSQPLPAKIRRLTSAA